MPRRFIHRLMEEEEDRTMKHSTHHHKLLLCPMRMEVFGSGSCSLCEDPVVGPSYRCNSCSEKFILHESCAKLPSEILKYPFHSCKHPLILGLGSAYPLLSLISPSRRNLGHPFRQSRSLALFPNSIPDSKSVNNLGEAISLLLVRRKSKSLILGTSTSSRYACDVCHREYNGGFSYTCSECDFKVDIKCAKIDYQPEHFIHKHPLMLNEDVAQAAGRPVSCSGCNDPVLGSNYYSCNRCSDFILHKSCVQLPRNIQHPTHNEHPLMLTTPSSIEREDYEMYHCHICDGELFINRYYYTCDKCKFHLDLKCASNWSNKQCIQHFSHEHLLFFGENKEEPFYLCNMCDDRVAGPIYVCLSIVEPQRGVKCYFFLHKSCAELPREIGQHPLHRQHPLVLKDTGELSRPTICSACDKICRRGFIYSCSACGFILDLKCAKSKWISGSLSLQHFSHEHPLMFKEIYDKEREEYTGPPLVCDGCQDPVLGPSYTCPSRKCCFNLHKSCAKLPGEIQHPAHRKHPLYILNTIQNVKVACFCNACNQVCRYRYNCSICDFNLHLKCASNWRKIFGCREHEFTVPRKEMALNCDICGEYRSGSGCYVCSICQLLVHKECASLPIVTKIPAAHQHHLKLTWFLEDMYPSKDQICNLCSTIIDDKCRAVYFCHECPNYVAHTTCITVDYFREQEENQNRTIDDADADAADDDEYDVAGQIKHPIHRHFLVANDHRDGCDDRIITCDGCIRPITTITQDFYSCAKQEEESCHFFLHTICAHLPQKKLLPRLHTHQFTLLFRASSIAGVFQCFMCGIFKQGFAYSCDTCALPNGENRFYLDLQCCTYWVNRRDLKHESHAHRLLLDTEAENVYCRGCGSNIFFSFSCKICDFHVCVSCVQLPLTARHRYDEHPLKLTYASVEHEAGQYYCEICEGKRDPTHWFYQCKECYFDCHPHCIIGRYPQVKLGSTYKHDAHVQHLVTLVSKWKSPIRFDKRDNILPCVKCGELCQGLVFECKECNINIHREGFCGTIDVETSHKSPQIEEL